MWRRLSWRAAAIDVIVAACATAVSLAELSGTRHAGNLHLGHSPLGVVLAVAATLPVLVRRRAPLAALAGALSAEYLQAALRYVDQNGGLLASFVLLYTVASRRPRRLSLIALVAVAGIPVLRQSYAAEHPVTSVGSWIGSTVVIAVVFGGVWAVGERQRRRQLALATAEKHAQFVEHDRDAAVARATEEERAQIARDLHDVVAHSVSVMAVQAGAARVLAADDPARAAGSMANVEHTAREALGEIRRMLGVLRAAEPGAGTPGPPPTLAGIADLARRVRDAGLDVELTTDGPEAALPASVELTAYRLVQESLTNVLRHAQAQRVEIALRWRPSEFELEVADDGIGAALANTDGGFGLVGMHERVAVFGGELCAGPRAEGGFSVRATIPLEQFGE